MLHQPADPFGIFHVRLSAGHVLEVPGVQKPALEVIFEQVVDGLPVDSCSLHAHQCNSERGEPIPQLQKPRVVAENSLISWWSPPASPGVLTHAVIDALCTSSIRRTVRRSSPTLLPSLKEGHFCVTYWKPLP